MRCARSVGRVFKSMLVPRPLLLDDRAIWKRIYPSLPRQMTHQANATVPSTDSQNHGNIPDARSSLLFLMFLKPKHRVSGLYQRLHAVAIVIVVVSIFITGYKLSGTWDRLQRILAVENDETSEMLQRMIDVGIVDVPRARQIIIERRTESGVGATMVGTVGAAELRSEFRDRDFAFEVIDLWGSLLALGEFHMCLAVILGLYMLTVRRMERAHWTQRLAAESQSENDMENV